MAAQNEQERRRLGAQVARSRKLRGRNWTQTDLARRAGVGSRRTITALERGEKVGEQIFRKIEIAFGWPDGSSDAIAKGLRPNPDEGYDQSTVGSPEPSKSGNRSTSVTTVSFGSLTPEQIKNLTDAEWQKEVGDAAETIRQMRRSRLIRADQVDETIRGLVEAARIRNVDPAELLGQVLR